MFVCFITIKKHDIESLFLAVFLCSYDLTICYLLLTVSICRYQKDVALISLANVLHRAQKSNEAAIVVHAALDISKELNVNHFTLGNIYAVRNVY